MSQPVEPYEPPAEAQNMSTLALREIVLRNDPTLRCRTLDADLFFKSQTAWYARYLCYGCPIRGFCAELALREEVSGYISGVRGGMSARERRALIRKRRNNGTADTGVSAVRDWQIKL